MKEMKRMGIKSITRGARYETWGHTERMQEADSNTDKDHSSSQV